MAELTILMVAENEKEYVQLSLEALRLFAGVKDLAVVVVDNGSTDGLKEWAATQNDFTYVYADEGKMSFGEVVNQVRELLHIDTDLLIMDPHFMVAPGALQDMQKVLHEEESIGAVGGISNGFHGFQCLEGFEKFEDAVPAVEAKAKGRGKQVIGLCPEVVLLKAKVLNELCELDGRFEDQAFALKDLCFQMVLKDIKLKVCETALFWEMRGNYYFADMNKADDERLVDKWQMHYFNFVYNHHIVEQIQAVPGEEIHVLEIGCDCGATLLEIKNRHEGAKVYGYEINEKAADIAAHFADVKTGNIEEENIDFAGQKFDYIIFGDVLEHLHNPLKTIQYCRNLLKPGGRIVSSIPNLMHISVIQDLLNGNFTYREVGLLDKTHIHMFTFNEILSMFAQGGYQVEKVEPVIYGITKEQEELIPKLLALSPEAKEHMYKTFQYLVCARME